MEESSRDNNTSVTSGRLETLADVCELLSYSFRFPTQELARAYCSGEFQQDLADCLSELDIAIESGVADSSGSDEEQILTSLRREYSRLYLSPGEFVVIYPYESAFLFRKQGIPGFPTLFANPTTENVEKFMRRVDALPETYRIEPVDSVHAEFNLMRLLLTRSYANSKLDDAAGICAAKEWLELLHDFNTAHITTWLPDFMRETVRESRLFFYRQSASTALSVLEEISNLTGSQNTTAS